MSEYKIIVIYTHFCVLEWCYLEGLRGFSQSIQSNATLVHKYPNSLFSTFRRCLVRAADGVGK